MLKKYFIPIFGLIIFLSLLVMPITAEAPGDFSITNPTLGEAIDASEKVKITWSKADGAEGYRIALRDLTTNEKLLNNKDLGNTRSYSVWLDYDHAYRVAVCAYSDTNEETWQECEFFTIPEQIKAVPEIISVSASPSSAPAGSNFVFTVKATEHTEEVTVEVDGYSIGTTSSYTTKSGHRIFTIEKEITSAGNNREVIAYALENGKAVSEAECRITVTESEPAGVPTITSHDSGDKHTVGESLTVSWSAPSTNPDSYNVYLYLNGQQVFSKQSVTAKKITIPGNVFSKAGTYSLDVYASKTGYKADSPATLFITVEKKTEPEVDTPTPVTPQETVKPSEPVQSVSSPKIYSVSSSPSTGTVNSQFVFTVTTNSDVKKVGVEIDGYLIGTTTSYTKNGDKRVFTISTTVSSVGKNKNVIAYAYDGKSKLSQVSSSTRITITDIPSVGVPKITSPGNGASFTAEEDITIKWSAPSTNPDSYNVYLTKNTVNTYSKKGISGTSLTIPASYFSDSGTYEVTVYAVKTGYNADNPASVTFFVSQKVSETPATQPTQPEEPIVPTQPPKEPETTQTIAKDDSTNVPSGTINTQLGSQIIVSKNPKINEIKVNMHNGIFGFMCQGDYTVVVKTNHDVEKIMIKIAGKTNDITISKYEDKWWFGDYREFTWKPTSNSQRWLFEGNTYTIDVYAYEGNSVLWNTKYSKNIKGTQPNNVGRVMGTI